jgi:hypothetical protein
MLVNRCWPIEFAEDSGRLWRRKLGPFLCGQRSGYRLAFAFTFSNRNCCKRRTPRSASSRPEVIACTERLTAFFLSVHRYV